MVDACKFSDMVVPGTDLILNPNLWLIIKKNNHNNSSSSNSSSKESNHQLPEETCTLGFLYFEIKYFVYLRV